MTRILSLMFFLLLFHTVTAQLKNTPPPDAAQYVQISEKDHDFGTIDYGHTVSYRLLVKNISKDSIHLTHVQTTCGCTVPVWQPKTYAPKDTFSIVIRFNGFAEGKFSKMISLLFNKDIVQIVQFHGVGQIKKTSPAEEEDTESVYVLLSKTKLNP